MHIAITGTSGRVGRAIVDMALADGHTLVCIDRVAPAEPDKRPHQRFVLAEMSDYDALVKAFAGCEGLIHMAAIPAPFHHPDHIVHNNNVVGSYNALRAAAEVGIKRICQASSVNAIGAAYSRQPTYDFFPVNETHLTHNEDPYSLSKWICEMQAESFVRRYEGTTIASLRFHAVVPDRATIRKWQGDSPAGFSKHLWGYTRFDAAARASLLSLTPKFEGAEAFFINAPDTSADEPSLQLAKTYYPNVPVTGDLSGRNSFFNCAKAERLLGWTHQPGI